MPRQSTRRVLYQKPSSAFSSRLFQSTEQLDGFPRAGWFNLPCDLLGIRDCRHTNSEVVLFLIPFHGVFKWGTKLYVRVSQCAYVFIHMYTVYTCSTSTPKKTTRERKKNPREGIKWWLKIFTNNPATYKGYIILLYMYMCVYLVYVYRTNGFFFLERI